MRDKGSNGSRLHKEATRNLTAVADARFHTLAYALDDPVIVTGDDNVVLFANPAADRLFEAGSDGLVGTPLGLALKAMRSGDATLDLPSGRKVKAAITVAATVWDGAIAWLATIKPKPAVGAAGAALDAALQGMHARFLAHINHELRTPLNSILGFAELLGLELHGPLGGTSEAADRYRGYAADIHSSGTKLLTLMSDLVDLSRAEAGELTLQESLFDLSDLVTELHGHSQWQGAAPDLRLGRIEPVLLQGDRDRIRRALMHLVANGLAYTPAGGAVTMSVTTARDGKVMIGVADDGTGFSTDALARAFEPFARDRDPEFADPRAGIGVGLALVRHTFELHGGAVRISSRAGVGATVTCMLPRQRVALAFDAATDRDVVRH